MKLMEIDYTKKSTGEKTRRSIMIMHNTKSYIDTIDLSKLTKEDSKKVVEAQKNYEKALKPYMGSFRRFSKDSMEILNEDEFKV